MVEVWSLERFEQARWWEIAGLSAVLNGCIVVGAVLIFRVLSSRRSVLAKTRKPTTRDYRFTAMTTLVNIVLVLPAWWLWTQGILELAPVSMRVVVEVVYFLAALDLMLYLLHRLSHQGVLYQYFHRIHHSEDLPPCELTLFVMHPVEAAGVGLSVVAMMLLWPVSVVAVAAFFGLNLLVGSFAHVPLPSPAHWNLPFGGSRLHQVHHDDGSTNYGFFTQFWDRALGTFR